MLDVYAIGGKPVAFHRMAFADRRDQQKDLKKGNCFRVSVNLEL